MKTLVSERSVLIEGKVEDVWKVLVEIGKWKEWTSQLTDIECQEPSLREGTQFSYRTGGPRIRAGVIRFEPHRTFSFVGRAVGIVGVNTWTLIQESTGTTRVTNREEVSGWTLLFFRKAFSQKLPLAQDAWLRELRHRLPYAGS